MLGCRRTVWGGKQKRLSRKCVPVLFLFCRMYYISLENCLLLAEMMICPIHAYYYYIWCFLCVCNICMFLCECFILYSALYAVQRPTLRYAFFMWIYGCVRVHCRECVCAAWQCILCLNLFRKITWISLIFSLKCVLFPVKISLLNLTRAVLNKFNPLLKKKLHEV